jgi:hypothetical protein
MTVLTERRERLVGEGEDGANISHYKYTEFITGEDCHCFPRNVVSLTSKSNS